MFETEQNSITENIQQYFKKNNIPSSDEIQWSPIPFSGNWGISTSFFQTAAAEARSGKKVKVPARAQEIAEGVRDSIGERGGFERIEAVRGYLNLYFSTAEYSKRVIQDVAKLGENFGRGGTNNHQVMVEFSQPNTHKAFHVGHLRSAILGDVVCRILEFAGYDVVRANYFGDIGLHVIKWLWNYMKFHQGEMPPEGSTTQWMGELYAEANGRLEENPEYEQEVREVYKRWDQREPEIVDLWKETKQWSLDGFFELYDTLDIRFDKLYGNSDGEELGKEIVQELIDKGIAEDERPDGPVIVRIDDLLELDKEKYKVLVVLRSDGTALYSTEDLALAVLKFRDYPELKQSVYVVDVRQSQYFQQVWKTLELGGYDLAEKCYHLSYELVNLPGNVTMASREGTVVLLEDLIREAVDRALAVVEEKNPDLDPTTKTEVANAVGLGAIKYPMLARDNTKIVTFDWDAALDFNGQAAPYIQYAHVRANSILRKAGGELPEIPLPAHELVEDEIELIGLISQFSTEVQKAAEEFKTLQVTNYAYSLAKAFNNFYNKCPVLQEEKHIQEFRLHLVDAARQVLANSLQLLGIQAPSIM